MRPLASTHAELGGVIVIVDDDVAVRRAVARMLAREGHDVSQASSGTEALDIVRTRQIDVLITDIQMPDMTGVDLLQTTRREDPNLPVLLMTGDPGIDTAMKAVEYGATEYLTKPLDERRLLASVARAIKAHRDARVHRQLLDSVTREKAAVSRRSPDGALIVDTVLANRYRIVRALGSGGMGTVYEAEREDLAGIRVAIKVLHATLAKRADAVRRFRREAELLAALHHPSIVHVIDFVSLPDETFIVMELLRGVSLTEVIREDPPKTESRAAFIIAQILSALDAAHAAKIVHRDLKPDNVLLTTVAHISDVVKVLDFGIAKLVGDSEASTLTQTGAVLGTPAYLAPEYARGDGPSALGDIYAVGCVLYEMLTKRAPFAGASYNALLFAILDKTPDPIESLRGGVSADFSAIVMRALAKDPAKRFQSAREMADALGPWLPPEVRRLPATALAPIESAPTEMLDSHRGARRPQNLR